MLKILLLYCKNSQVFIHCWIDNSENHSIDFIERFESFMQQNTNVLFVVFDDLNDSISGMGGHPQAKTPNLDRLMQCGVRFTNAQCNAPICGPSRASFLSGIYPHNSGFFGYEMFANSWMKNLVLKNTRTFMEHFRENGYAVCGTGKIFHHNDEKWEVWDDTEGIRYFGVKPDFGPYPWDGTEKKRTWGYNNLPHPSLPSNFITDDLFARLSDIPEYRKDEAKGIPGYKGWILGKEPYKYVNAQDRDFLPDEASAQYAVNALKTGFDSPFLMCVGFIRPHAPLIVPDEFFDMFPLEEIETTTMLENDLYDCAKTLWEGTPDLWTGNFGRGRYKRLMEGGGAELLKKFTQAYLASVAFADAQLGKVLNALESSPYAENTLIVVTSDNGFHMGEKEQLYKNTVWEEAARVPLIIAGPGVKKNAQCTHPVSLIDIYPTLTDYCNISSNPHGNIELDGYSLRTLLENPEEDKWDGPDIAITAVASSFPVPLDTPAQKKDQHYSVRSKRFRYVLCRNDEEELYDHDNDPYEWKNLAQHPDYNEIKKYLRKCLIEITGCR